MKVPASRMIQRPLYSVLDIIDTQGLQVVSKSDSIEPVLQDLVALNGRYAHYPAERIVDLL